ncbi:MAG: mechanosensitive ion channel [Schleiferiaceae bacterium]
MEKETQWLESLAYQHWAKDFFVSQGLSDQWVEVLTFATDLVILAVIAWLADFITRRIILNVVHRIVSRTKATWDDSFYEQKVFRSLSHLVPALILKAGIPLILVDFKGIINAFDTALDVYIIYLIVTVLNKTMKAIEGFVEENPATKDKPYRTLIQVLRIINYFVGAIFVISILFSVEPGSLLGAFAGTTAILILIFQDAINGLLANFQISMYDLLRKGDWVTFEKYGVDGTVTSVDLTTVKVQNFDNTISSVPAKAFTSDSFVNWRGMQETNVRRIKRNINIDINSIKYIRGEDLKAYEDIQLVAEYMDHKESEIATDNTQKKVKTALTINGRQQTNVGLFRQYIAAYLKQHPMVNDNHTLMVRQLQPTEYGIPLEVYCFANTIVWTEYEEVQADIFDHLYAAAAYFDLQLFQSPSGKDILGISKG